jgi:DNA-binding IclR family transcriptional regulator
VSETVGTIVRALSVLRVIAEAKGTVGVKDVALSLGLPMSTSHRLLDLLRDAGFVEKEATMRRYAVGAEFFRIANLVTHKTSFGSQVQPLLDELTQETGETALFGSYLAAQHAMTYAAKSDSPHSLRFRVELFRQAGLEWGSTGLAILAFLPDEVQTAVFRNAQPSSISGRRLTRGEFLTRLATVRRDGFAMTESEKLPDSVGIAAPLEAAPGVVIGSIALTIPKMRFVRAQTKVYVELVRRAAARFSSGIAKPDVRPLRAPVS